MKRLIVCCDGCWESPALPSPSNVSRMAQVIEPVALSAMHQVVLHMGQGSETGDNLAQHLDQEILTAYRFLILNHAPGDEIWFFGASRGAYVARSCIGLMRNCGLLHKAHCDRIDEAYRLYRTRWNADASNAVRFRDRFSKSAPVRFLGVWDTVGHRGIPSSLADTLLTAGHGFHDSTLSSLVRNAFQALAIDERRAALKPALWTTPPERSRTEQCWMSGNHGDICGGYANDNGLSWLAFEWMATHATALGLALDNRCLESWKASAGPPVVHGGYRGVHKSAGTERRSIGATNRDETLHSSAEQRFLQDTGYRPPNLRRFLDRDEQIQLPL